VTIIRSQTTIARPIEEVFDFAVDLRNELQWNPKVESMVKLTDGPVGVGTRMSGKWTKSKQIELECTRFDRPHSWTWVNGGPVSVTLSITLTEVAEGTRLDSSFDARPNGLFRLVFPIFIRMMRKEEAENMVHLKAHLEAGTASEPPPVVAR
jgi:uncharacterized protein YndB with AHSA1/START domain